MSSWDFNSRQIVSFNKLPIDENTNTCFDLDHDSNTVKKLTSALSPLKLSDDYHSDNSEQPHTSMLKDNNLVDNKFDEGEHIPVNLFASLKEWNSKGKVTNKSTRPSRPFVKLIKTRGCQNSPFRSPLAKRICLTGNSKHLSTKSQSTVAVSYSTEAQKYLPDSDSLLKSTERNSMESNVESLYLNRKGRILCRERSQSLSSVNKLSMQPLDLSPTLNSAADSDRNFKLACAGEPEQSDAKLAKKKKFPHNDKGEQLGMKKLEETRKGLVSSIKIFQESFKIVQESVVAALAVLDQPEIHSTRETTKPVPFHFATDNRCIQLLPKKSRPVHPQKYFAMLLRQPDPTLQKTQPKGTTVVPPFNLTADKKRKREDETAAKPVGYKFQTMAEKVLQFCTKTPERFCRKHADLPSPHESDMALRKTIAESPNLRTKTRNRKVDAVSREEQEENEVQEMKKIQFKALPLNKRILGQRDRLKSVPLEPKTVIEPFKPTVKPTATLQRTEGNLSLNEETCFEFHAQPIPKAVCESETFSKKDVFKCKIPQSSAFSWKKYPVRTYRASASDLSTLTEERAARRKVEWQMWKKERERERQEWERKRLEKVAAEVQQLRRESVPRANPIRYYKPLEARDVLPLIDPQSPNFSERLKPQK